ncbi:MAG: alanyl-tRNA editing protein [Armatimonadota bacterium]|nr:alanyl-tRNA editing protein [Armatimonadota bacterium]MDR7401081.1 alanyl-tRNA editing protein [Armatimonadota bacterium]MDR7403567.1 alanyl-tRNA editing protein [Armatimonadota bacterium]MDR7436376.1 alanyl-tRNA editing protein [Armatimonadota bacterium]MDR7471733.1 alanyl-tRNA editing protein [Armatimonadota bacterium]
MGSPPPATRLLYLADSYLREFDAAVTAVEGSAVALDATAFYPGGGGQPADVGVVRWATGTAPVVEVRRDGQTVWHVLDGSPPAEGTPVRGALDWPRRYAIMRHHTALHVLVGVIYRLYGARVTGGAIYPDRARMDFSLEDLSPARVAAIEAEANRVIAEDRPIRVRWVSREEFERSDLMRLARARLPEEIREVRVVEIDGFDAQADGGTHVARTAEIGRLRITRTENKGRVNRRLEIALEAGGPAGGGP